IGGTRSAAAVAAYVGRGAGEHTSSAGVPAEVRSGVPAARPAAVKAGDGRVSEAVHPRVRGAARRGAHAPEAASGAPVEQRIAEDRDPRADDEPIRREVATPALIYVEPLEVGEIDEAELDPFGLVRHRDLVKVVLLRAPLAAVVNDVDNRSDPLGPQRR